MDDFGKWETKKNINTSAHDRRRVPLMGKRAKKKASLPGSGWFSKRSRTKMTTCTTPRTSQRGSRSMRKMGQVWEIKERLNE